MVFETYCTVYAGFGGENQIVIFLINIVNVILKCNFVLFYLYVGLHNLEKI